MLKYLRPSIVILVLCSCFDVFAQSTLPYNESFRNATAPGMIFGGSDVVADKSHKAFLTARTDSAGFNSNTTDRDGNPIAANPNDAEGAGYLRLTKNARFQSGYARNTTSFPSANGLSLSFEYYTHGGGGGDGNSDHADGISVFLYDASATSFTFGANGGSLGYAQRSGGGLPDPLPGVSKGYLGIGFDEFGNFATVSDGKSGGNDVDLPFGEPDTWSQPNSDNVTIRGDGDGASNAATNYEWKTTVLVNQAPFNFPIRGNVDGRLTINPTTRPAGGLLSTESGYRKVKIDLIHINNGLINGYRINIYITVGTRITPDHVLVDYDYYGNADRPLNLSYGFGASTGNKTNIHEIRGLAIVVPSSVPVPPNTGKTFSKSGLEDAASIAFTQGDFYNTDFTLSNFTDPNGDALANVRITNLPDPAHGLLKFDGNNITDEQIIPYADLGKITFVPAPNYNGSASFTWRGGDAGGLYAAADATVNITITAVNDEPSFTKGANQTVNEDSGAQTVTGWATAISKGPANENAQILTFTVTNNNNTLFSSQPAINSSGDLTYTPAANANGTATVSVILSDNGGTANGGDDTFVTQTFTITVTAVNDEPSFTKGANQIVNEDSGVQTVTGWATAINKGPTNENGQSLTFSVTNDNNALFSSQPVINSSGDLTYTPAANANGLATVSIVLNDNGGVANGGDDTFATQTFTITVNETAQPSTISGSNSVCIGATGVTYSVTNEPGHTYNWIYSGTGHTITAGTGTNSITVSYSTSATSGTWSVTATNTTTTCTSIARTYVITVNSTPQPSVITGAASVCVGTTGLTYSVTNVASTTYAWTYSGTGATITAGGTTNSITVSYASNATSGNWSVTATGTNTCTSIARTLAVTLNALPTVAAVTGTLSVCTGLTTQLANTTTGGSWSSSNTSIATVNSSTGLVTGVSAGTATITYTTATNNNGCINTATATVTVTASPVVAAITGASGTTVGSTAQLASTTTGGTWSSSNTAVATVSSTGLITGVAAGTATITYAVTSGACTSSVTKVITIAAAPVNNNPPVAVADAYSAVKGATLTVAVPGVLSNDSDPDSNPITAIKVTDPAHGTLTLNPNGSFTYVHNNGTSTSDSFTYKVNDGIVDGNTVTVSITISSTSNTPPVIVDIPKTGKIDQTVTFTANDFTSKFTDPNGDALSKIKVVTLPPSGTLKLNGVNIIAGQEIPLADLSKITFVPPAGFSGGPISFQWNGSDGTDYAHTPKNVNITIDPTSISISVTEVCIGDVPWVQYTITGQGFTPAANSATIQWKKMDGTVVRELTNQALTGQLLWPGAAIDANGIPTAWPGWNFTAGQWVQISDGLRPQMRLHISINPETEVIVNYPPATPFCSANPNRPPVVSNITKSSTGFLPIPFTVADFTSKFTDPDSDPLVKIRIQTLPPDGVLKLNGIPVTVNQEIPVADLAKLTFEPALNWSGTTNFTWNGSDGDVYATSPANTALTVVAPSDPNAKIGLAKNLASITPALNGTYDVKFVFTAVNFGPNGLESISIKDNLALAFGGAEVTVKTVTAFGNLKANSSFNGSTNTELLLPTSRLVAGEEAKVELLINVKLLLTSGVFQNTATAEAISSLTGFKVSDVSTNGLRPDPNSTADVSPSETTPIKLDPFPTYVPAGFSPNGDGMNDKFVVQNANGKHVSLEMYNRWGNRVYKSDDYKNDWGGEVTEGFFLGRDIPDGTYYYIIIIDKKDKYAGFITVNR